MSEVVYRDPVYRDPSMEARLRVGFALAFAAFGAPLAWMLQLIVNYSLSAHACYPINVPLSIPEWGGLFWILLGVDMAAIIVAGGAFLVAVGQWRVWRGASRAHIGERRNRFISKWALMTSGLFSIAVIFTIVMIFIEPVCNY